MSEELLTEVSIAISGKCNEAWTRLLLKRDADARIVRLRYALEKGSENGLPMDSWSIDVGAIQLTFCRHWSVASRPWLAAIEGDAPLYIDAPLSRF